MHEDYQRDALPIDFGLRHLRLHVFSPVDLAVRKIARFGDIDKQDIQALLSIGLTTLEDIEQRAMAAMHGYVGRPEPLLLNLWDVLRMQIPEMKRPAYPTRFASILIAAYALAVWASSHNSL